MKYGYQTSPRGAQSAPDGCHFRQPLDSTRINTKDVIGLEICCRLNNDIVAGERVEQLAAYYAERLLPASVTSMSYPKPLLSESPVSLVE
jgi:hypothetical protein